MHLGRGRADDSGARKGAGEHEPACGEEVNGGLKGRGGARGGWHVRVNVKEQRKGKGKGKRAKFKERIASITSFSVYGITPSWSLSNPCSRSHVDYGKCYASYLPKSSFVYGVIPAPLRAKPVRPISCCFMAKSQLSLPKSDYKSIIFYLVVSDVTNPLPLAFKDKWDTCFKSMVFRSHYLLINQIRRIRSIPYT